MPRYQSLDHTADVRIRIFGRTLRELFQNAAFALTDILVDLKKVGTGPPHPCSISRSLKLKGDQLDLLFISFLKEILFLFDTKRFLTRQVVIKTLNDKILVSTLRGETLKNHPLKTEIKAVTYHKLKVQKKRGGWRAEVILDV